MGCWILSDPVESFKQQEGQSPAPIAINLCGVYLSFLYHVPRNGYLPTQPWCALPSLLPSFLPAASMLTTIHTVVHALINESVHTATDQKENDQRTKERTKEETNIEHGTSIS